MRLAIVTAVLLGALQSLAQVCPSQSFSCPGTASASCGSACDGKVTFTRTATCNGSGTITSCVIRASTGESCNCLGGSCSLNLGECPCLNKCGEQCLDGQDVVCCGDFVCPSSLDCCQNGVQKCIEKGGSCCEDGVHGCPAGSDCVSNHCCPRLTTESQPFTAYDGTTGYCCGDQSCASTGQCQGGAGLCACANPCNGSCCPSGTTCCSHKGWCAPDSMGCPFCPASHPTQCGDGTCAPAGAICCGKGLYCPNGLSCVDCGGGNTCCGGGGAQAQTAMTPAVPDGGGAVKSTRAAMATGEANASVSGGSGLGATGCGGSTSSASGPQLGIGFHCACSGDGGAAELLAIGLLLRALRGHAARRSSSRAAHRT